MTEHKKGCWYPRVQAEEKRYHENWPAACGRCEGWGYVGGQYDEFGQFDADVCPDCLEQSKCPRCAGGVISEAYWEEGHLVNCDNCAFVEMTTAGYRYVDEPCQCIEPHHGWLDADYFADLAVARDEAARDPMDEPYPCEHPEEWREGVNCALCHDSGFRGRI